MLFFRRFLVVCALVFCTADRLFGAGEIALESVLTNAKLWSLKQDEFQSAARTFPFRWTSARRESARAAYPGMTLFGLPVYEVVARFGSEKLNEITAVFYARGDAGDLSEEKFEALKKSCIDAVSTSTGVKPTVRGKDATNAVKAEGLIWQTQKSRYELEYSFTKEVKSRDIPFRAEFIRLEIRPADKKSGLLAAAIGVSRPRFSGAMHIKRDPSTGDVWLHDVPMVDQGQKGYCVVATAERVMRYYGNSVDANELAQVANSDAEGGTSMQAMHAALKKIAARLKVRVRSLEEPDVKETLALIKDYNRHAKRLKATEIADPGMFIDMGAIYRSMEYEVLKETRTRNKADFGRFQRGVQTHIDQGVPLLWSVQLGLAKETGIPQSAGGHMRLIIGYNTKTQEILYSDSWGAGHELKRMATADAWTITVGLTTIEPI